MSLQRVEVLWSPNNADEFASYCTELSIYRVQDGEADSSGTTGRELHGVLSSRELGPMGNLQLSSTAHGRLIGTLPSAVSCMPLHKVSGGSPSVKATTRSAPPPSASAVGQSSGKVLLVQYSGSDQPHLTTLSPRSGRPCICVCWNPAEPQQLAVGMDKARNDSSLIVWDTNRVSSSEATPTDRTRGRLPEATVGADDAAKTLESGHGEATSSIAWLPTQSSCLVAGMGNRFLRIFDTRDSGAQTKPQQVANHKAILGLSVCPSLPHQLASYAEGSTVYIWDVRLFSKPVYSFSRSVTIERLSWLPTRPDCLSIVSKEAPYLHLVDIPSLTSSSDAQQEISDLYMEHLSTHMGDRHPYYNYENKGQYKKLVSVDWHPKKNNIALVTTMTGHITQFEAHDRMALAWTATSRMVYSSSERLIGATICADIATHCKDISDCMRERVAKGYGFEAAANVKLLSDDEVLQRVWVWLQSHQETQSKVSSSNKGRGSIPGVWTVLSSRGVEGMATRRSTWEAEGVASKEAPPYPVFLSAQRDSALVLCGWSFANDGCSLEDFIKREELAERYERAAAVSVFRGDLRRGIMTLTDGATLARQQANEERASQLQLIALSLSGYSPRDCKLWHHTCLQLKSHVSSPYLRAVFNFLSNSGRDDFRDITSDSDISLQDRVAFACTYLDDSKLQAYIATLMKGLVTRGDISALFLTGLPADGLTLLKNYVNQTGDVQTACLVAGQVMSSVIKDKTVHAWFQGYRGLLDQWQMWKERAVFDSQRKGRDASFKPQRQAAVTCHFCSKTITGDSLRQDRRGQHIASSRKSSSCPSCRKPLPRCALCLLHMVATGSRQPGDSGTSYGGQSGVFGQWFTWCQTCRHGGHANHIAQWFSSHKECPVTGCSCNCYALDNNQ